MRSATLLGSAALKKIFWILYSYAGYKNLYSQAVNAAWAGLFPSYFVAFP